MTTEEMINWIRDKTLHLFSVGDPDRQLAENILVNLESRTVEYIQELLRELNEVKSEVELLEDELVKSRSMERSLRSNVSKSNEIRTKYVDLELISDILELPTDETKLWILRNKIEFVRYLGEVYVPRSAVELSVIEVIRRSGGICDYKALPWRREKR